MPADWFGIDPMSPDAWLINTTICFGVFLLVFISIIIATEWLDSRRGKP